MTPILTSLDTMEETTWGFGGLQQEMSRLLDGCRAEFPSINVWSNPDKAVVTAELPGMDAQAMSVSVIGNAKLPKARAQRKQIKVETG